jgi:hypothetical protein
VRAGSGGKSEIASLPGRWSTGREIDSGQARLVSGSENESGAPR